MKKPVQPTFINLAYTRKKPDQDIWIINWQDIPIIDIQDQQIIHFAPRTVGGNHRHPRTEWYIGFGNLMLYWLDSGGKRHQKKLGAEGKLILATIPPFLPHAVRNYSPDLPALLLELSNTIQTDVEHVKIY